MSNLVAAVIAVFSTQAHAGDPHALEVPQNILTSPQVESMSARHPNYYFSSLSFEESDNGWTEHVFRLVYRKHSGAGSDQLCFWIDYDENQDPHVTRISPESCQQER